MTKNTSWGIGPVTEMPTKTGARGTLGSGSVRGFRGFTTEIRLVKYFVRDCKDLEGFGPIF